VKNLVLSPVFFPADSFSATAAAIASVQLESGAIPWFQGHLTDPWDHIESAMGLTVGGRVREARRAYLWLAGLQEPDGGFWPAYDDSSPLDTSRKESHHAPYLATGLWHYYLCTRDQDLVRDLWPSVRKAVDFACRLQSRHGEVAWAVKPDGTVCQDALVTGNCSIYKSLECGLLLGQELGKDTEGWREVRDDLGLALRTRPERFDRTWDSKARYSMDWFYPVLAGVLPVQSARQRLRERWDHFVVPTLGCRCVSDQPWITVAESCELVMSLLGAGHRNLASRLFSWLHVNRNSQGAYWTGYQMELDLFWPAECPTWTSGAVLLAADALTMATPAAHVFTSVTLETEETVSLARAQAAK
jgi:hypothetical protein